MAETLKVVLSGDKEKAYGLRGLAMQRLAVLKELMRLGGLRQDRRATILEDGSVIECAVMFGTAIVSIYATSYMEEKKREIPDIPLGESFLFIVEDLDVRYLLDPVKFEMKKVPLAVFPYEQAYKWLDLDIAFQNSFSNPGTVSLQSRMHNLSGFDEFERYWAVSISRSGGYTDTFPTVVSRMLSPSLGEVIVEKLSGHHYDYRTPETAPGGKINYMTVSTDKSVAKMEVTAIDGSEIVFKSAWNPVVSGVAQWWSTMREYMLGETGWEVTDEEVIKHGSYVSWNNWISSNFGSNYVGIGKGIYSGCHCVFTPVNGKWVASLNTKFVNDVVYHDTCDGEMSFNFGSSYSTETSVPGLVESLNVYSVSENSDVVLEEVNEFVYLGKTYCNIKVTRDYQQTLAGAVIDPSMLFPLPMYYSNYVSRVASKLEYGITNWYYEQGEVNCSLYTEVQSNVEVFDCVTETYTNAWDYRVIFPDASDDIDIVISAGNQGYSECYGYPTGPTETGKHPIVSYAVGKEFALLGLRKEGELTFYLRKKIADDWGSWEDVSVQVNAAFPPGVNKDKYHGFFLFPKR